MQHVVDMTTELRPELREYEEGVWMEKGGGKKCTMIFHNNCTNITEI